MTQHYNGGSPSSVVSQGTSLVVMSLACQKERVQSWSFYVEVESFRAVMEARVSTGVDSSDRLFHIENW